MENIGTIFEKLECQV